MPFKGIVERTYGPGAFEDVLPAETARGFGWVAQPAAAGRGGAPVPPDPRPQTDPLAKARDAIRRGAPRDKVIARLRAAGIDTAGL
jgi:hypothetical protein